ncbi:MAG: hypothetical protein AAGH76_03070 [Pseudomonadota bacterium]
MRFWSGLIAAAVSLGGCVSTELKTADISYYSKAEEVAAGTGAQLARVITERACVRLIDERIRTEAQGWSFPREQIKTWFTEGITARLGVETVWLERAPAQGPYLALETLYIKHIATSMAGVVVLRAHGFEDSRAVRGNMTRMNWNGTDREFSRVLSQALDEAISKLPLPVVVQASCD